MGACGPCSSHVLRGGNENGSPSDIVIELEPLVCPGVEGLAGLPSATQPLPSTGDPSDRDDNLHRRVDSMDTLSELCTEIPELPQDSGEAIVVWAVGSAAPWFLIVK